MKGRGGFTLIELMVAVGVASLLLVGVAAAGRASQDAARRQRESGAREDAEARALEILRADWRGRTKAAWLPGGRGIRLTTTSDGLAAGERRAAREVDYEVLPEGLRRTEGVLKQVLLPGTVVLSAWDGGAWRKEGTGPLRALRLEGSAPVLVE